MASARTGLNTQPSVVVLIPSPLQSHKQSDNGNGAPEDNTPAQTPKQTKQTRCAPCAARHRGCDLKRPVCTACLRLKQPVYCRWPDGQATANPMMVSANEASGERDSSSSLDAFTLNAAPCVTANKPQAVLSFSGPTSNNLNQDEDVPNSLPTSSSSLSSPHSPSLFDAMAGQEGEPPLSDQPSNLLDREPSDSAGPETNMESEATPSNNSVPQNGPTPQPPPGGREWSGSYQDPADAAAALRELEHHENETDDDDDGDEGTQVTTQPQYPFLHADSHNVMFSNPLLASELQAEFDVDNVPAQVPHAQHATATTPPQPTGLPLSMINPPIAADPSLRIFAGYSEALGTAGPVQAAANPRPFVHVDANGRSQAQLNWDAHQVYFRGHNPHVGLPHAAVTRAVPTSVPSSNRGPNPNFAQPMVAGQAARQAANTLFPHDLDWEIRPDDDIFIGQFITRDYNPWRNIEQMFRNRAAARANIPRPDPPVRLGANGQPELDLTWPQHTVYYPGQAQNTRFQHPDGTDSCAFPPSQPDV